MGRQSWGELQKIVYIIERKPQKHYCNVIDLFTINLKIIGQDCTYHCGAARLGHTGL